MKNKFLWLLHVFILLSYLLDILAGYKILMEILTPQNFEGTISLYSSFSVKIQWHSDSWGFSFLGNIESYYFQTFKISHWYALGFDCHLLCWMTSLVVDDLLGLSIWKFKSSVLKFFLKLISFLKKLSEFLFIHV